MLLDLLPLLDEAETVVVTGGGGWDRRHAGPLRNPLPEYRQPRQLRDDEEALLVAALI